MVSQLYQMLMKNYHQYKKECKQPSLRGCIHWMIENNIIEKPTDQKIKITPLTLIEYKRQSQITKLGAKTRNEKQIKIGEIKKL